MNDRDLIFEQYKLIKEEEEKPVMTVNPYGDREWRLSNGLFHRRDGPAYESVNGSKIWFLNGKRHRVGGPAVEYANGINLWHINDKIHREDGPAITGPNGISEWYLNDQVYPNPESWAKAVLKLHKKPHDKESIEEFLRDIYAKNAEDLL